MSFGKGFKSEDELRIAMLESMAKLKKPRKRSDSPNKGSAPKSQLVRGERTRAQILEAVSKGPIRSIDILDHVNVAHNQVKTLLRQMLEEGKVQRYYQKVDGRRIAIWSLPSD